MSMPSDPVPALQAEVERLRAELSDLHAVCRVQARCAYDIKKTMANIQHVAGQKHGIVCWKQREQRDEARATIARVEALCEHWEALGAKVPGGWVLSALGRARDLRKALEGEEC